MFFSYLPRASRFSRLFYEPIGILFNTGIIHYYDICVKCLYKYTKFKVNREI